VPSFQAAVVAKPKLLLLVLMFLAFMATLYVQYAAFEDPYRVNDDFRQYYWMERFVDPDLLSAGDITPIGRLCPELMSER